LASSSTPFHECRTYYLKSGVLIGSKGGKKRGGYKPIKTLNTKCEQNFFKQLLRRLPNGVYVACKVRLADICLPKNNKDIGGFNAIAKKHVDFVLIDQQTSEILCVIELDDRSHNSAAAKKRGRVKDSVFKSAQIKSIRVKASRSYRKDIDGILESVAKYENELTSQNDRGKCPKCSSEKYQKVDLKGLQKGKHYYLCEVCRFSTEPVVGE
jgi:very-short-patch-repair endonuclease